MSAPPRSRLSVVKLASLASLAIGLVASAGGCAMGPVEPDPVQADARAAQMKTDCLRRGGVWNEEVKTCLAADPIRR
jgi:hypothetical protein